MKILFVEPHESSLFSFRKELVDALIREGHEVVLCIESTERIIKEYANTLKIVDIPMDLKNKRVLANIKLINTYKRVIKKEKPDLILSYKIKPNIYCGLFAKKIPMVANITGLGNMFKKNNLLSKLGIFLYKKSFKNVKYVFFQNEEGASFFKKNKICLQNYKIIPGSGVNLDKFPPEKINKENSTINFLFASRPIREKGFELLAQAIPQVLKKHKNVHFNFLISEEDVVKNEEIRPIFEQFCEYITILPRTYNVRELYVQNDFLVSPSYYREGISNVLLESLACARPIITTLDNAGCREVLQDGINGFGVFSNDLCSLVDALDKAASLSKDDIYLMGLNGRKFVETNFDRNTVIKIYLDTIKEEADF